jgi:hypothetical protein
VRRHAIAELGIVVVRRGEEGGSESEEGEESLHP